VAKKKVSEPTASDDPFAELLGDASASPQSPAPAPAEAEPKPEENGGESSGEPLEFVCPRSGEVVAENDVDALWEMYSRCQVVIDAMKPALSFVRESLAKLTADGDKLTRRARGLKYQILVEYPSSEFSKSKLLEIWNEYPNIRGELMKVAEVKVSKTELKKALETNGPKDFNAMVKAIKQSEYTPTSLPSIKLDKVLSTE
jgi:hypothetical protein